MNYLSILGVISISAMSFVSCKGAKQGGVSTAKDFAANPNAKNFAIIASFAKPGENIDGVKSDIYNWNNVINRGDLGKYRIFSFPVASKEDLKTAFSQVAAKLDSNSTLVFAFTGEINGSSLRVSDGVVDFNQDLMSAFSKTKKSGQRLYIMHDTVSDSSEGSFLMTRDEAQIESAFRSTVEFKATSGASSVSNTRLATEFAGELDTAVLQKSKIKIKDFYDSVVAKTGEKGGRPAAYKATDVSEFNDTLLSKNPPAASGSSVNVGQGANLAGGGLDFASLFGGLLGQGSGGMGGGMFGGGNGGGGSTGGGGSGFTSSTTGGFTSSTTGGQGPSNANGTGRNVPGNTGNAKYVLVEVSLGYCGPCHALAKQISEDPDFNGTNNSGCAAKAIITDGDMETWKQSVPQFTLDHTTIGTAEELRQRYPKYEFTSFPVVFMTDAATGELVDAPDSGNGYPACPGSRR